MDLPHNISALQDFTLQNFAKRKCLSGEGTYLSFEKFWDVGNCFSVKGNFFPSIYDNVSTQVNYQNNQMVLRRMPKAGDFSTKLMLDFN